MVYVILLDKDYWRLIQRFQRCQRNNLSRYMQNFSVSGKKILECALNRCMNSSPWNSEFNYFFQPFMNCWTDSKKYISVTVIWFTNIFFFRFDRIVIYKCLFTFVIFCTLTYFITWFIFSIYFFIILLIIDYIRNVLTNISESCNW